MRVSATIVPFTVLACAIGVGAGGCGQRFNRIEVSQGAVPEGVALPEAAAVVGRFAPARIAVHPLSRLEGSGDARRAVVHIQVLDAYGHDVKWPGAVSVEVAPTESFAASRIHWVDLTGGEENARVFDTISRCYTLRVPAPGTEEVYVKVRWLLADEGGRPGALDAQGVLSPSK